MPVRTFPAVTYEVHHVFSKSIAGFKVFRDDREYERMRKLLKFYTKENPPLKFSAFLELKNKNGFQQRKISDNDNDNLVKIIAYCFMPTHFHLVLKQVKDSGI